MKHNFFNRIPFRINSEFYFTFQILMNAHKLQILVRTSVAMYLAASGACALLGLYCSGMDALVQGWREGRSSLTAPESGQDSAHSWCQPSAGQLSPALMEYLALPGRVVLWATAAEMVHAWVRLNLYLFSGRISEETTSAFELAHGVL